MALTRQGGIFNMDGGKIFDVQNGKGIGVEQSVAGSRFDNIADFRNLVNSDTTWGPTQWGDEDKRLAFSRYGYKIIDSIWTEPKQTEEAFQASPISSNSFNAGLTATRLAVIHSLSNGQYLYVDPETAGNPANEVLFAWVPSHTEATRFNNLAPITGWLEGSVLGDNDNGLIAGFEIEFYVFTQPQESSGFYEFFAGLPTGPRDIQRVFLPFSKGKGQYLFINDLSVPPNEMEFAFTASLYEAVRFDNVPAFETILNATILKEEAYGWEIPQYYFNGNAKPLKGNPFDQFWCVEQNGPYVCIGLSMLTCDWLCKQAPFYESFIGFHRAVSRFLEEPSCYPDSKAFRAFFNQQDYNAYLEWLQGIYKACYEQ